MTTVYCRDCGEDVHITSECVKRDDHSTTVPRDLRGPRPDETEADR